MLDSDPASVPCIPPMNAAGRRREYSYYSAVIERPMPWATPSKRKLMTYCGLCATSPATCRGCQAHRRRDPAGASRTGAPRSGSICSRCSFATPSGTSHSRTFSSRIEITRRVCPATRMRPGRPSSYCGQQRGCGLVWSSTYDEHLLRHLQLAAETGKSFTFVYRSTACLRQASPAASRGIPIPRALVQS